MMRAEAEDASKQLSWLDRLRYRPRQWSSIDRWQTYEPGEGEPWFRFEAVRDLRGVPPEILLVPLRGHTLGHAGVAVRDQRGWLLVAGDAYFWQDELDLERPECPPGLRVYQWLMEKDRRARLANQRHLRELLRDHRGEVRIVCSHDPRELDREVDREVDRALGATPRRPVEVRPLHIVT
jgi:glyoxylase-like metal-dependent hydrolase (beta-lactamase superfamily II)